MSSRRFCWSDCDVSDVDHERLRREGSVQWGGERLYADRRVPTPDGRSRFAPTPDAGPAEPPDEQAEDVKSGSRGAQALVSSSAINRLPAVLR